MPNILRPILAPLNPASTPTSVRTLPPPPPFPVASSPQFRILVPPNTPRPTPKDITLEEGFDGRTPEQALNLIRGNAQMSIHDDFKRLTEETILSSHKAFHLSINNLFVKNRYPRRWAEKLQADEIVLVGPLSQVSAPLLKVTPKGGGAPQYHAPNTGGVYLPADPPGSSIIMEARLTFNPDTVAIRYLPWRNTTLSRPYTFEVLERP